MKKYIIQRLKRCLSPAVILLAMITSCEEEILKENPLDFLAPMNAYTTLAGIRQGITGLHVIVRAEWIYGDQDQGSIWKGIGTDIAFHGEDPNSTRFLCNYVNYLIPASQYVLQFWYPNYQIIQRANVLIEGINDSDPDIWESETQKQAFIAEAMFFRAYAYRILVSMFGDVPIVNEVISSAKADFVRDSKADVYKLMEDDLIFAAANLPEPGDEEAPGRVTQGAAWHYLSEVYLAQNKFQLAVDAASKVIDGYNYALMTSRFGNTNDVFGKGDVYLDLFAFGNQNLAENTEGIWVIQFEPLVTGGHQWVGERAFGPAYFRIGNTPDGFKAFRGELVEGKYTGYSDTLGRPVSWIRPTYYATNLIWQSDWDNDIRNAKHNIKRDFYFDNPESSYDGQKIDFNLYEPGTRDPIKDTCQYIYPYFMKFADPLNHFTEANRSGGGYNHKDQYAIRLAETILLRAEAYIGLGKKDLAAEDINAIRNRANATPVLPADVDIDYMLDERTRELYGEEQRQITLRRVGKLVERVRLYNNNPLNPGLNIQDHHVLWPIPLSQIDLNIDAEIIQNPGY